MSLDRILGSAQRRVCLIALILLVLIQAQSVQAAAEVSWAVIPSWEDPDIDDDDDTTAPRGAGDIEQAGGLPILTGVGRSGSLKPLDMLASDQSPRFSDLTTRAPPATLFRIHSLAVNPFGALSAALNVVGVARAWSSLQSTPSPTIRS